MGPVDGEACAWRFSRRAVDRSANPVSHIACGRRARLRSVASTNLIMDRCEAWIAAMPPSHSALRTAGSLSLDCASRADSISGESLPRKVLVAGRVGGKISPAAWTARIPTSAVPGRDRPAGDRGCVLLQERQAGCRYIPGSRSPLGLALSCAARTKMRAKSEQIGAQPCARLHQAIGEDRALDGRRWTLAMSAHGSPIVRRQGGVLRHLAR